jgi:hypothetical protein
MNAASAVGVQVVGFGPAAMGIAVAADRFDLLDRLLDSGLVFLERWPDRATAAAARFPWRILSNSPGRDFLESIRREGAFAPVLRARAASAIVAAPKRPVWLRHVSALLRDLGDRLEALQAARGRGGVRYGAVVARIAIDRAGLFTSYDAAGAPLVRSRAVVLATGARERIEEARALLPEGATIVASSAVLAGDLAPVEAAICAGAPVVILGSSHSAFGVAELILRTHGKLTATGQVKIAVKGEVALYHASLEEARASGSSPAVHAVCRERGEVNRFNGLRGPAKELCLRIRGDRERRVAIADVAALPRSFARETLFISALGYTPTSPPLFGADGAPITLATEPGFSTDEKGQLLTPRRELAAPWAFGIGLGHPHLDGSMRPRVGLNCFHGPDAARIVRGALYRTGRTSEGTETPSTDSGCQLAQPWR